MSGVEGLKEALQKIVDFDTDFHEVGRDQYGYAELEECMNAEQVRAIALSAIEGGGGALQPSASVPTEQADGGVLDRDWLVKIIREHSFAQDAADMIIGAMRSATPPATPIAGGFGSNRQGDLPTEPVTDRWADLERLAREWDAISPDNPSTTCKERGAFRDAANPAAILELIAAARQQPNRGG